MSFTQEASTTSTTTRRKTLGSRRSLRRANRRQEDAKVSSLQPKNSLPDVEVVSYFKHKHLVDSVITTALLLIALPVMVLVGLTVLVLDGRPVFYRQTRVGKDGRLFRIWKFRTMKRDAESTTGAVWSCDSDPRVTKLGQWLRCSHLDELPQFFNVLSGDMNLIGPRPERPEFVRELVQELPLYKQRTKVAPGITGLAQIRTGYDHCVADVSKKVALDLQYIQSANFLSDIGLLAQTCGYIVRHLRESKLSLRPMRRTIGQIPAENLAGVEVVRSMSSSSRRVAFNVTKVDHDAAAYRPDASSHRTPAPHTTTLEALDLLVKDIEQCA